MDKTERKETIGAFMRSLDRLEVGWTKVSAATFHEALEAVLALPAIGAELPFEGLSLAGLPIALRPTPAQIIAARTGVTAARLGIADYGSVVIEQAPDATEPASLFPGLHVAVLRASDVVPDMPAAFQCLGAAFRSKKTSMVLTTGPSATADMGALVRGAHGPSKVHVIILEDA